MRNQINDIIRNDIFFRIGILRKKNGYFSSILLEITKDNLYE